MSLYRTRVTFTGPAGAPWVSTGYFAASGGTAQQAATAVWAFWNTIRPYVHTSVTLTLEPQVDEVDTVTGNVMGSFPVTGQTAVGQGTGELLPRQTQGLLRLRTGVYVGGREVRGRWFLPGQSEPQNDVGGVPTAAMRAAVDAAAATLIASANAKLSVYSPKSGTGWFVNSGTMWSQWASLRSRRD